MKQEILLRPGIQLLYRRRRFDSVRVDTLSLEDAHAAGGSFFQRFAEYWVALFEGKDSSYRGNFIVSGSICVRIFGPCIFEIRS